MRQPLGRARHTGKSVTETMPDVVDSLLRPDVAFATRLARDRPES